MAFAGTGWLALVLAAAQPTSAAVRRPAATRGPRVEHLSERTVSVGLRVSRDEARLVAYTVKNRPFLREPGSPSIRSYDPQHKLQLEIVLAARDGRSIVHRADVGPLCLLHGAGAEPHVEGDTILLHEDTVVVEVPELRGFDRIDVAYYERDRAVRMRRPIGSERLDRARFTPAGSGERYEDLALASPADTDPPITPTSATVFWPEQFGDDPYLVFGNEAETSERINVVIVPDGYRYGEKAAMEAHASAMVNAFRNKTPYAEHDRFINYILVYAYSQQSGTDQCDCGVILDTAMGTRFPNAGGACGSSENRCLYYGGGCDTSGTANIVEAELRAPAHDETIVMVNTTRYGGCGGARSVYSAGNSSATEIALHEMGHSMAGLADEYVSSTGCGGVGGEINTSTNAIDGAWREWIADLGPPVEGARYWSNCIYRPQTSCEMRSLGPPFCPVCNQRWALVFYGHPRVSPTAPIASASPGSSPTYAVGEEVQFSITTRLAETATNSISWEISGPTYPQTTVLATDQESVSLTFSEPGQYVLESEVIADVNFIKPQKYGANVEGAVWLVEAACPAAPGLEDADEDGTADACDCSPADPEESRPAEVQSLLLEELAVGITRLSWDPVPKAETYSITRGDLAALAQGQYGTCLAAGIVDPTHDDAQPLAPGLGYAYLVQGAAGYCGTSALGYNSAHEERINTDPAACMNP